MDDPTFIRFCYRFLLYREADGSASPALVDKFLAGGGLARR